MMAVAIAAPYESEAEARIERLRDELADRDEIIVALQHIVRDLRHEIENARAEHVYAAFARTGRSSPCAAGRGPTPE
ncbi:MAG TPA: hypothetical protein VIR14_06860 [Gaiellaceae bacterium]